METFKKFCSYFCPLKVSYNKEKREIILQELPLEMILNIFKYLSLSEVWILKSECRMFRIAAGETLKDELRNVRLILRNRTMELKNRVVQIVTDHRMVHPGLIRSLLDWRNLQSEVSLLNVMIWRYKDDTDVWGCLAKLLVPILDELNKEIKSLTAEEYKPTRKRHPLLDDFLRKFTEEVEVHFYKSEMLVPFEVRLIDLLLCCPCGNLKMVVKHGKTGYKRIEMYSVLKDFKEPALKPEISVDKTRCQNEREILHFMRDYIRISNNSYVKSVVKKIENYGKNIDELAFSSELGEIISYISTGDESSLDYTRRTRENGDVEETYERYSSYNLGKSGLYCSFEVVNPFRSHSCGSRCTLNPQHGVMCMACTHAATNNVFTLGVICDRANANYAKEMLVIYETEKKNYSLSVYKHLYS